MNESFNPKKKEDETAYQEYLNAHKVSEISPEDAAEMRAGIKTGVAAEDVKERAERLAEKRADAQKERDLDLERRSHLQRLESEAKDLYTAADLLTSIVITLRSVDPTLPNKTLFDLPNLEHKVLPKEKRTKLLKQINELIGSLASCDLDCRKIPLDDLLEEVMKRHTEKTAELKFIKQRGVRLK